MTTTQGWTQAAASRLSLETTFGTAAAMSTPASTPFTVADQSILPPVWALGAGSGISCYEKTLIPLFATGAFKLTPYLECGAGYGFAANDPPTGDSCWHRRSGCVSGY